MSTSDNIDKDLLTAVKAKDVLRVETLRMVRAALKNKEIEKKRAVLEEKDVLAVLAGEKKKRMEAAEAFRAGGRGKMSDKELKEAEIISAYLPEQLSDEELDRAAKEVIEELSATSRDFGKIMKVLMAKIEGRADGAKVSAKIKQLLSDAGN